jgi:signal transduction histidine kinase
LARFIEKLEAATDSIGKHIEFTRIYQDLGTTQPRWQDISAVLPRSLVPQNVALYADLPSIQVYADPILEKVFSNLLDNSLRHGKHVKTIRVSTQESADELVMIWEDDGIGIPAKEKEKIFGQGYGKNTGMGLFLAREILSITGIMIKETGKSRKGARFEMTVPKGMWRVKGA